MWSEDDTFGRWVQGLCAIPLLAWTYFAFDLMASGYHMGYSYGGGASCTGIATAYLAYRCLRYAVTGRNNINRDDDD
jgi:hypothetical protein